MQPISEWLKKLGLGQYAQCFAENGIDFSVLRHLTDQDLKDIGVLLGHWRKMLAAIAELVGGVPVTLQPPPRSNRRHRTPLNGASSPSYSPISMLKNRHLRREFPLFGSPQTGMVF
jgi:hypothetical protein